MEDNFAGKVDECLLNRVVKYCLRIIGTAKANHLGNGKAGGWGEEGWEGGGRKDGREEERGKEGGGKKGGGWWLSGCCGSVSEHWQLKPEVSWV